MAGKPTGRLGGSRLRGRPTGRLGGGADREAGEGQAGMQMVAGTDPPLSERPPTKGGNASLQNG